MPSAEMLTVFAYDIANDRRRRKVAKILENGLVRVQESVFEGRLTTKKADAIRKRIEALMKPDDSLRVYAVPKDALARCHQKGGAPVLDDIDYWLL